MRQIALALLTALTLQGCGRAEQAAAPSPIQAARTNTPTSEITAPRPSDMPTSSPVEQREIGKTDTPATVRVTSDADQSALATLAPAARATRLALEATASAPKSTAEKTPVGAIGQPIPLFQPNETGRTSYSERVVRATQHDLAGRLGVAAETIVLVESGEAEVASGAPCGGEQQGRAPAGVTIGYAVTFAAGEGRHRYVASGARAYYCGPVN